MQKRLPRFLVGLVLFLGLTIVVYNLPPVHEHLVWRVDNFLAQVRYFFKPPEQAVFQPTQQAQIDWMVTATLQALTPTVTPASTPVPTIAGPTVTPTLTPTSIPSKVSLNGVRHEYQKWNNCGPANLSMALSFWGWGGDQRDVAAYTKPNQRDKNVMPYELADFVNEQTSLRAIVRVGGDLDLLKRLIAGGFPVLIEKGFEPDDELGWMGHYEVLTGYDDARQKFTAQDSYIMPDFPVPYDEMTANWRAFNYAYIVVYPPDREAEVLAILGPQADETANFQHAVQLASDEIYETTDPRDQFFAWFNRGTNLVHLQDYASAAAAYDQAFFIYPSIPEKRRPWRMLWYQTGPYFAYYYTGRYYDVISLATTTIDTTNDPAIEESFFWRARAKVALGDINGAIADFRESLKWHPDFSPTLEQLQALGIQP